VLEQQDQMLKYREIEKLRKLFEKQEKVSENRKILLSKILRLRL